MSDKLLYVEISGIASSEKIEKRLSEYNQKCVIGPKWRLVPYNKREMAFLWDKIAELELRLERLEKK